jgi:glycosyltransferase involved in cell wall biosynthesis
MGYVPNDDLPEFYKRARALVMPTFFGPTNIPPLEAFALGCPVAVSNIYGISEQVGDAALLFDPKSVGEIAAAIKSLWVDNELCSVLIDRGRIRDNKWGQSEFNNRFLQVVENLTQ